MVLPDISEPRVVLRNNYYVADLDRVTLSRENHLVADEGVGGQDTCRVCTMFRSN